MRDVAAGPAGYRRDPGQRGQRPGVGEPGPAVADLGQEPGSAQRARAREAGEDVRVGVGGQLAGDLGLQGLDLSGQAGHGGGQRGRDAAWAAPSPPVAPGGADRSRAQTPRAVPGSRVP